MRPKVEFTLEQFAEAEQWAWEAFKAHQASKDDLEILNDSAKDLLAGLMTKFDKPEDKTSEAKLERLARDTEEWRTFKLGLHAAIRTAGQDSRKYKSSLLFWETCQSGLSYKKIELSKLGA